MRDFLTGKKHVHFIGIGGSGMYPLAQILHKKGFYLTGSDNNETETLDAVRNMGITVYMGQCAENIGDADLVVYTAAIMSDNPELIAAKERESAGKCETIERSVLLGLVTSWHSRAICVSGTHGKTTCSSMLTHILLAAGKDISAVIGGKIHADGQLLSGLYGESGIMVCEACEFADTFLKLDPNISVVLNIDNDHMDYFKTPENLQKSFISFIGKTSDNLIINGDDNYSQSVQKFSKFAQNAVRFGCGLRSKCDSSVKNNWYPSDICRVSRFDTKFNIMRDETLFAEVVIHVAGEHNILNAVAAAAAAVAAGCAAADVTRGLDEFKGVGRRFEMLGFIPGTNIAVADDYAHHPAEIRATLNAAAGLGYRRVIAVHQPFTYSRTYALLDDFADALKIADKVILTEIMGSREKNTFGVYSKDLAEKIDGFENYADFEEVAARVKEIARDGDLIITLGCGDVYKIARILTNG